MEGEQPLEDWGTKTILLLSPLLRMLLLLALPPQINLVALISLLHALCLVAGDLADVFLALVAYLWAELLWGAAVATGEDPHPINV
jgi:hypothetical protein